MSSEIPQREEFERYNQFRVELPDAQRLYYALSHAYAIEPRTFMSAFKIGSSHSEDELFSQINVHAMVADKEMNFPIEGYSIYANLAYQNPDDQYWQKEQAEQLQRLLNDTYGYNPVDRQTEKNFHSLIIKDSDAKLLYVLNLGTEDDERTTWKKQVEAASKLLEDTNPYYGPLLQLAGREALNRLINSNHPAPMDSHINVKPIDADPNISGRQDLFPPTVDASIAELLDIHFITEEIKAFANTTKKWGQFIEDAVNAMSKVKGIPQSGRLTLLPPSEIPQS